MDEATALPITSLEAGASLSLADVDLTASSRVAQKTSSVIDVEADIPSEALLIGDVPTTESRSAGTTKRFLLCLSLFVIVLTAIVVVANQIANNNENYGLSASSGSPNRPSPPMNPDTSGGQGSSNPDTPGSPGSSNPDTSGGQGTPTTETVPRPDFDNILTYLVSQGVSSEADLMRTGSPQNKAANWLSFVDERRVPVPSGSIQALDGYHFMARYVMALFFYATGGDEWFFQMNFLKPSHICSWNDIKAKWDPNNPFEMGGVICSTQEIPVIFDVEYNNLVGTIPSELGLMSTLMLMDFIANPGLSGGIPTDLCRLTNLRHVTFSFNSLGGRIPSCIENWSQIDFLNLEGNNLSGPIPSSPGICSLSNLQILSLQRNKLEGNIPDCMGDLSALQRLWISSNQLIGELPQTFSRLSMLADLRMNDNRLIGDLVSVVKPLTKLVFLYAEENSFSSTLDDTSFVQMRNLTALDLSGNMFASVTGVPTHLFELPTLRILDLSRNNLAGSLSTDIPDNSMLWLFSVYKNELSGEIPGQLQNLRALQHLDLSHNNFVGPLPNEIFEMTTVLNLILGENPGLQEGSVPPSLLNMTQLWDLSLKNSNRIGPLPELIGFNNLTVLDLDNNAFTGMIPSNYGLLPRLTHLLLNRNQIEGDIPIFTNARLRTLTVDGTGVSGDFSSVCALPAFSGSIEQSGNELVIADCGKEGANINCDCCHCCGEEGGCSDPQVDNLNWTWESQFRRAGRDFAINQTLLVEPTN